MGGAGGSGREEATGSGGGQIGTGGDDGER